MSDLIASQVTFGLAYVREARSAYDHGRYDYADLARQIAMNAYSTATRFAARLPDSGSAAVLNDVARFKYEVEQLQPSAAA
ncbi:MAG TPA: hypothetical protein VHU83_19415 [Bryobacteraceae bacterium]|nr:hypothetical protein [Bryobacteraceae bacterium]